MMGSNRWSDREEKKLRTPSNQDSAQKPSANLHCHWGRKWKEMEWKCWHGGVVQWPWMAALNKKQEIRTPSKLRLTVLCPLMAVSWKESHRTMAGRRRPPEAEEIPRADAVRTIYLNKQKEKKQCSEEPGKLAWLSSTVPSWKSILTQVETDFMNTCSFWFSWSPNPPNSCSTLCYIYSMQFEMIIPG